MHTQADSTGSIFITQRERNRQTPSIPLTHITPSFYINTQAYSLYFHITKRKKQADS